MRKLWAYEKIFRMALERRQKYFEDILKKQQRQIFKVSRELELHREFLNLQFGNNEAHKSNKL